jgi:nanoRNase/pAp phosphatase (c-di-AMP/oligoRNAs hydrolase)
MKERLNALKKVLSKDDRLLIIINPDPDAMASAMALERLCRKWVTGTSIARRGSITRLENQRMKRLLKIKIEDLTHLNINDYTKVALVDGQPDHFAGLELPRIDIIIDHHKTGQESSASFKDIRPQYGATSTIMAEYLEAAGVKPGFKLATALCYGIKTDTNSFERDAIRKDALAFGRLFMHAHPQVLMDVEKWKIPKKSVPLLRNALSSYIIKYRVLSVFLGRIKNPDDAVIVADFLNSIEDVYICAVSALVDHRLIVILRESGLKYHVGNLAARAFGGSGSAGGHRSAARAEIDIKNISDSIDLRRPESVREFVCRRLCSAKRGA